MLIDKGYYDYDFNQEAIDKGKGRKKVDKATREAAWKRMGFGALRRPGEDKKRLTAEEAQRIAMAEIKEQHENKLQIGF